jgi:4-amino-4-deoxy-L-arabinose transferase-like glycosyltransferase
VLAGGLALVAILNLLLVVLMVPESVMSRAVAWVDARVTLRPGSSETRRWDGVLPYAVAIWVVSVAVIVNFLVLEGLPHIADGASNLFQARYFAAGHLYLPAPPDAASFQVDQTIIDSEKWYGYAFPAWPLILAVGVRLGAPWLVNPLLGGLLILVGHRLVRHRCDRATANIAVLTLSMSPWLIFMSAEFMGHPLTALLALTAALSVDRATAREPRWAGWAVLAGIALGSLMLTRALDGVIVAAAIGVTGLIEGRRARALPAAVVTGVVALAVASLIFPYNKALTGRANYPPHLAWSDGKWGPGIDRLGFGKEVGIPAWRNLDPLPGHGPADVVLNANKNLFMTNADLFGWAGGSLIFVWLAFALGRWRRGDALMLALSAAYFVGYSFYWFSGGPDIGARYWYSLVLPLAAISARGAQMLIAAMPVRGTHSHSGARVGAVIVVATLGAGIAMLPWRATAKFHRYRGITGEVRQLAASSGFQQHALVFVRTTDRTDGVYDSAFDLNPRTLEDPGTIYAFDAGPEHRAAVVSHFPDRQVWVIGRPSPGEAIKVFAGPLAPGTVPQ